jgi:hypothetical protein
VYVGEIGFDSDFAKVGDVGDVNERFGLSFGNEDAFPFANPAVVPVLIGLTGEVDRFLFGLPPGKLGRFAWRRLGVPKFLRWHGLLIVNWQTK